MVQAAQLWRKNAACLGVEAEIFYPDPDSEEAALPARQVCNMCSVKDLCLEYALKVNEKEGIWGGCTERERRRIIRQRRRSA